jgi:cell division protein FtsW
MFKRTEESKLTSWFFEIDRRLLYMVLLLMLIGMFFAVSAGSVVAYQKEWPWYTFLVKGLPFYGLGLVFLFGASLLNKKTILKLSFLDVIVGLVLLAVTFIAPTRLNNSDRFIVISGLPNIMPADIMKPGFIIVTAWFLAEMHRRFGEKLFTARDAWKWRAPNWWIYIALFVPAVWVIFQHPDVGTSLLYLGVLICMLLIAGLPWLAVGGMVGAGVGLLTLAYYIVPHVHKRIDTLLTGNGENLQVTRSVQSIQHGGFFGSGDNAFVKEKLPDAHTDFIYAAIVEDLGAILAIIMLCLLIYVLKLLVTDAVNARDRFVFYAVGGTAALFGIQCCINLVSTLGLFAPKGMTLPFISYGGSSLVGFCLLFGMVLAIVREDKWRG